VIDAGLRGESGSKPVDCSSTSPLSPGEKPAVK